MNRTYFGRYRRYLTEAVFANHNSQGNRICSTLHVRLSVSVSVCVLVYVVAGYVSLHSIAMSLETAAFK